MIHAAIPAQALSGHSKCKSSIIMEYENPTRTQCSNSDIISTLPQNINENILSLMPIRDALRTSVLSKKWRYSWRSMPKLVFTDNMVSVLSDGWLNKYKLVTAIFHVLMFHNGPEKLELKCSVGRLHMESEFAQIISYLVRGNTVKELIFAKGYRSYKLPVSFFSLQGLEAVRLEDCTFEPPLTFSRFSCMRIMVFVDVEVSAQMLQRFLSNCPLLQHVALIGYQNTTDFGAGGNTFTFVDFLQLAPLIKILDISKYYMKYLCAGGMPHRLPTSLVHLSSLFLDVCLMEQNEISAALCLIRSSPQLEQIIFLMYDNDKLPVRQSPTNFLDPEGYPDLKLDHLELLEIEKFSNLPVEMDFVKLIMAKSRMLKNARIKLNESVSVDEELKMLRDLVQHPVPRASPSAKLSILRP